MEQNNLDSLAEYTICNYDDGGGGGGGGGGGTYDWAQLLAGLLAHLRLTLLKVGLNYIFCHPSQE